MSIICRVIHVRGSRALAVLSAVALAMVTERAGASTFYVSPGGNDTNSGALDRDGHGR